MQPHETTHHQPPAAPPPAGHETVIKFVLSGPMLAEHGSAQFAHVAPTEDVAALRERVDVLERAVADAHARLEDLSLAVARAIPFSNGAANRSALTAVPTQHTIEAHDGLPSVPPPLALEAGAGLAPGAHATFTAPAASLPPVDRDPVPVVAPHEPGHAAPIAAPKARGLRRMISVLKHN